MFGLAFLAPVFLTAAAAVAVPVLVHLFRRRTEEQVAFSAVRFLRRAPTEEARRRRLRELLLLALRVAAVLLLALAFARPYLTGDATAAGAPVTIVAVDVSYSMSAPGQFARALELAGQAVGRAPSNHLVGVIAFDDEARTIVAPATDRGLARSALTRLTTGFGATNYRAALARGAELSPRAGRIVLVTDRQRNGWDGGDQTPLPGAVSIEVVDAGSRAPNLAIVDLERVGPSLTARIRNAGSSRRTGAVRLTIDDRRVDDARFAVDPDASTSVSLDLPGVTEGLAAVSLDDGDGYAADNIRYLLLDPPAPVPVMAVTATGNRSDIFYLERALTSGGPTTPFRIVTAAAADFDDVHPGTIREQALVWLLGTRNMDRRGRTSMLEYVRNGGALMVAVGPDVEPDVVADLLGETLGVRIERPSGGALSFAPVDPRHPIFRAFGPMVSNLSVVRFSRAAGVSDRGTGRALALFNSGQGALVEYSVGEGRILVFGSDLGNRWNDFPLQPTFVPFVHETVRYLTGSAVERAEILVRDLPPGAEKRPGAALLPPGAGAAGRETGGRRVAVNVDARESDPARLAQDDFLASIRPGASAAGQDPAGNRARDDEDRQRLWQYGLALMIVGLVAEGLLGSRLA
jgi:hypothetical protein